MATFSEKNCKNCKGLFMAMNSELNRGRAKFCSVECYRTHPKSKETIEKIRLEFLKTMARGVVHSRLPRGSDHHNWSGGKSTKGQTLRSSPQWREWREYVFKRDSYRCFDCGETGYLEPHHIIPLKEDMKKAFDKNNGITLCRPCHRKTMGKELKLAPTYSALVQVSL